MAKRSSYATVTPVLSDYVSITSDPGGTPLTRNSTIEDVLALLQAAPSLLTPTAAAAADGTTATGTISTDTDNGVIYTVVTATSEKPTAAQVFDGTDSNGNPAANSSQAVSATGTQNLAFEGLDLGTQYYVHYMHQSATGLRSAVVTSAAFTTSDVPDAFLNSEFSVADATSGQQIDLTVSALPTNNGAAINDIEYTNDDGTTWRSAGISTATTANITLHSDGTSLDNGVSYEFRLRAENINGHSVASPDPGESATPTGAPTSATYEQAAFRFYEDDGAPGSATAMAALNTGITPSIDDVFRCRFLVKQLGTDTGATPFFRLQYRRKPLDGSFGSWTDVGTNGVPDDPIKMEASTHFADKATIAQLLGSGTFTDGEAIEVVRDTNTMAASVGQDEYEIEANVTVDGDNTGTTPVEGDTYELRLERDGSTALDTYAVTPSLVIPETGGGGGGGDPGASVGVYTQKGGGAAATGGGQSASSHVVWITSLADDVATSGCLRWALEQHPGDPLYIVPRVEGGCVLTSPLICDRPNVTLDFRTSPGEGYWLERNRFKPEADNFVGKGMRHYGNDTGANNDSDNITTGPFSTNPSSSDNTNLQYFLNCADLHGRDENRAITVRGNQMSTGNTATKITFDRCMIADPVNPSHAYLFFIGDGADEVTLVDCILWNGTGRLPMVKAYADRVEVLNVLGGGNFNDFANMQTDGGSAGARVIVEKSLVKFGPNAARSKAPYNLNSSSGKVYFGDVLMTGNTPWTGDLWRSGTPAVSKPFTQTIDNGDLVSASVLETRLTSDIVVGAPTYGGALNTREAAVITEIIANTETDIKTYPGTTPTLTGDPYPDANVNFVPDNYLEWHPGDTNPEAILAEGNDWDGYMVIERVAEFMASSFWGTSPP